MALQTNDSRIPIGIGFYTVSDASKLLKIPAVNIRRWLGGYTYSHEGQPGELPPLWTPQLPPDDGRLQLGFRDLIELRFVQAFKNAGLNLITIRYCLEYARKVVNDERPFSTQRFRTDGKTIFLESVARSNDDEQLLDLRRKQYTIKRIIERSFKDLDFGDDDIVKRWRPYKGKSSIVVDPQRAFGQPVASKSGVPTIALAQAVAAEGSAKAVARLFEVSTSEVRDAVAFEKYLQAA